MGKGRLENAVLSCARTMTGMVSAEVSRKRKEWEKTEAIEEETRLAAVIDRILVYSEERIEIAWKMNDWFFPETAGEKELVSLQ